MMDEPNYVTDLAGGRLDALEVASMILQLAVFGYHRLTMRYAVEDEGHTVRVEFYEHDYPRDVTGLIKNFSLS